MTSRRTAGILTIGALGLVAAACGGGGGADVAVVETTAATTPATDAATTTVAETTTSAQPATTLVALPAAPLTGVPVGDPSVLVRSALAVKMDNHPDARPHAGLNQADVIYEEIVEGITRFFVIFHSTNAEPIGPVRSARTTDVDLLNQLNRPLFAWSGGNRGVVDAIGRANAVSRSASQAPGYFRDEERLARADLEHTLMHQSTLILFGTADADQGTPPQMFQYRAPGEPGSGAPVSTISTKLNSVSVRWEWDADQGLWIRDEYGAPHLDITGAPISGHNVVFQFCDYRTSPADPKSPEAVTVGSGEAWVFSDGKLVKGRWDRPEASAPATFTDESGAPILLTPGRTWIELAEAGDTEVEVG